VGRTFRRAYRYIKAAYFIYEDNMEIVSRCMDNAKVNKLSDRLKDEIMGDKDIADRRAGIENFLQVQSLRTDL